MSIDGNAWYIQYDWFHALQKKLKGDMTDKITICLLDFYEPMFVQILGTGYTCFTMQNQHGTVVVTILRSRYTVSRCVPYLSYNLPKNASNSIFNEFVPLLKRPTWYQFKEADTLSHDVYHTTLLQLFNQYFFVEAFYDATYEGEIFFNSYGKTMLQ